MPTTTCLRTGIKNPLSVPRFYGYLGPHGMTLDAGETVYLEGDVISQIAKNARHWASFDSDVTNGKIEVVETPAVHLKNLTSGVTQVLTLDDVAGTPTLGTANPCWQ